jgi:hypothetical protein
MMLANWGKLLGKLLKKSLMNLKRDSNRKLSFIAARKNFHFLIAHDLVLFNLGLYTNIMFLV